jgi:hypothetical protein
MGYSIAVPISRLSAFMLSLLGRQYLLTGAKFVQQHPYSWLVWEPGEWTAPSIGEDPNTSSTRLPSERVPERPLSGDALCFELKPRPGTDFTVGRAEENNIVINDMTVSREHVRLSHEGGQWAVQVVGDTQKAAVAGQHMALGQKVPLESGTPIRLGGIQLTYYEAKAFVDRVQATAERLRGG